ncbi:hypothetical protein E2F50_02765 [Rhizobium deserti]|uniref:Uncharacterized protein n=1 Tax=Rhizobium deserti TaxID=2547961 RepID=A0A4R5UMG9_9HYPH|nr:hypothetical protein [Rhizobium deserti]TDK39075.1 hypothetical protein E2F50_02765 [Rhizobium deserti]
MRITFVAAAILGLAGSVHADPLDTLTKAEGKVYDAWTKLPLTEREVTFITAPSQGYGIYQAKQGNVFKPGEKIITYVEPIGYGWKELPGDMYEMNFISDLLLKTASGEVVSDQKGFAKNVLQSHSANMEFSMDFTLNLTGAPAGKYLLTYTIHDISADQTSTFDQELTISE